MHRLWEILLGLDKDFLARDGVHHWHFDPHWPLQQYVGASTWNFLLIAAGIVLIYSVYRREGRSRRARIFLGALRGLLLATILVLLNRPVLTLVESVNEPSVLAILVDDTISMQVRDAGEGGGDAAVPRSRLEAVTKLLTGDGADNASLLRALGKSHLVKFYRFSAGGLGGGSAAEPIATLDLKDDPTKPAVERERLATAAIGAVNEALSKLQPVGNSTQVVASVRSVLEDLQGQHVAGVVVLSDGRDNPDENLADAVAAVKTYGVKVFPIPIGSKDAPRNIDIRALNVQDSAFKGDIVNVKTTVHATGYEQGHPVRLTLTDAKTKAPLRGADGLPVDRTVNLDSDKPQTVELQFKATQVGMIDVTVEAAPQQGEISDKDNRRASALEVLDTKINVLYVEGYPRWEYRYVKNEMIREPTINMSCYLQSADSSFIQEHSKIDSSANFKYFPYTKFPETIEQLQETDVVLFGDVEPQRLSDSQLQLIRTFVEEFGGGFGMIAGAKWAPFAYRNTPLADLLPVTLDPERPEELARIDVGFRPVATKEGEESTIFRFRQDSDQSRKYLKEQIPPVFWFCTGVTPKPGLAEVFAEHPEHSIYSARYLAERARGGYRDDHPHTPGDDRKAPLLVAGHFGAGRTLFSAIDDSWRWRFYTGESVFDTYWVQQLRYLARSKKIGSRGMTFTSVRDAYEVGDQVRLSLHVLNRKLLQQLPEQLGVEIQDQAGQVIRRENLVRQEGQGDTYVAQFPAERIGTFTARLPPISTEARELNVRIDVNVPAKELEQPQVDRTLLVHLADETSGLPPDQPRPPMIELPTARADLLKIPSAAVSIPFFSDRHVWGAPLVLTLLVLLITAEWILRKVFGML